MTEFQARQTTIESLSLEPFYDRFRERLIGLSDEEYLWEPVENCLSVSDEAGAFVTGGPTKVGPFTTIAWRMCHIGDFLRDERNARWFGREPEALNEDIRHPLDADGGIAYVEESWLIWTGLIASMSVDELWEPLGPIAGPYGDGERFGLIIHIMDELIHHAAEVGVVRDLYAARGEERG